MPFNMLPTDLGKTRLTFGQHKGRTFDQVPVRHLDWLVGQSWVKREMPDLYANLAAYLARPSVQRELSGEMEE